MHVFLMNACNHKLEYGKKGFYFLMSFLFPKTIIKLEPHSLAFLFQLKQKL